MLGRVDQTSHFGISVVTTDNVEGLQNDREHHPVNEHELKGTDKELITGNVADNPIEHHPTNDVAHCVEKGRNPIVVAGTFRHSARALVGATSSGRSYFPNRRL